MLAVPGLFADLTPRQTNIDVVADILEKNAAPSDLIIVAPWYMGVSFDRYYHGKAPWLTLPNIEDRSTVRYDLLREELAAPKTIAPCMQRIRSALRAGNRVWIAGAIAARPPEDVPDEVPPAPEWGWNASPYTIGWEAQAAQVISTSATSIQMVSLPPSVQAQRLENLPLYVVQGPPPAAR
jgi:hypothetical protein